MKKEKELVVCGEELGGDIMKEFLKSSETLLLGIEVFKTIVEFAPKDHQLTQSFAELGKIFADQLASNKAVYERIDKEGMPLQ